MAETLTFENQVETTSIDNLNSDEQDSLQVGEQMQEAQDNLLAGKYKDAQELESAYIELQKKLGEPKEETTTEETPETEAKEEEKKEEEEVETNILDTLWEEAQGEKYKDETLAELNKMSPSDLANLHLQYRKQVAESQPQPKEISEADVKTLKDLAGGEQGYTDMLSWAKDNLNEQEISMFDQVMGNGDPLAAFFAVRSLAYRYDDAKGVEGKMLTGTAPKSGGDVFRSQAEVVRAMGDPRYDRDPAFRQDIQEKLARSNLNF
tara:strand:- start:220 stop:1011 length:792 start_codon:yes stop_codon:yes gene_type:complete